VLSSCPASARSARPAEHLRKHHPPGVEVVPLFARLSQQEQDRIFEPHSARRIVLATNCRRDLADGARHPVRRRRGTARVKRYSYRSKVEQLQIEPVSQAAATSARAAAALVANRHLHPTVTTRRTSGEAAAFTDPEILRFVDRRRDPAHECAGWAVERGWRGFPVPRPPPRRAVADGYQLLERAGGGRTRSYSASRRSGRELCEAAARSARSAA
jgi:ATP-dependent helicase HrpA